MTKPEIYNKLFTTLDALCEGETDHIALMATICCELYQAFEDVHWAGFYRNVGNDTLKIGPYQGTHGCLTISFDRGVCGRCARERKLQNVSDVTKIEHHIACSSTTRSEIVVPIIVDDELVAVLDIDSDTPAAFDEIDEEHLRKINRYFTSQKPRQSRC